MATEQLPEELLQLIIWHLKLPIYGVSSPDDNLVTRKTLLSCMLASHTFYRLAQPVLYHTISQHQLRRFVQLCIRRPDLAALVREIHDSGPEGHDENIIDGVNGLEDLVAWREETYETCALWQDRPYEVPFIGFALLLCTRLETLVHEQSWFQTGFPPTTLLTECAALCQTLHASHDSIPLAALQRFVVTAQPSYEFSLCEDTDDNWLAALINLPKIQSITLHEFALFEIEMPASVSNLRSLTIGPTTKQAGGYTGQIGLGSVIERLLPNCPLLETLDLTFGTGPNEADDYWDALGRMLSQRGQQLRNLHIYDPEAIVDSQQEAGLIHLTTMTNLRNLTLPIEALLSVEPSELNVQSQLSGPLTNNREPQRRSDTTSASNADHTNDNVYPPTVPLTSVLPPNLTELTIIDDSHLQLNAVCLDLALQEIMQSPRFMDLRKIQIRRKGKSTEHVKDIGWQICRCGGYEQYTREDGAA